MFAPEDSENVEFHSFQDHKKKAEKFKRTLPSFFESAPDGNHFFYSIVYGFAHLKTKQKPVDFEFAVNSIGIEKFLKLEAIKVRKAKMK